MGNVLFLGGHQYARKEEAYGTSIQSPAPPGGLWLAGGHPFPRVQRPLLAWYPLRRPTGRPAALARPPRPDPLGGHSPSQTIRPRFGAEAGNRRRRQRGLPLPQRLPSRHPGDPSGVLLHPWGQQPDRFRPVDGRSADGRRPARRGWSPSTCGWAPWAG